MKQIELLDEHESARCFGHRHSHLSQRPRLDGVVPHLKKIQSFRKLLVTLANCKNEIPN